MPSDAITRLLELLRRRSLRLGEVKLASGRTSNFYIDGKKTTLSAEGAGVVAEAIWEATRDLDFQAIGGPELGAVPIAAVTILRYAAEGRTINAFYVRKAQKEYGTKERIGGCLEAGDRAVVVEDVVTTGDSVLSAIDAIHEYGAKVVRVICLVDRLAGAIEKFRERGLDYRPLLTRSDFPVASEGSAEPRR